MGTSDFCPQHGWSTSFLTWLPALPIIREKSCALHAQSGETKVAGQELRKIGGGLKMMVWRKLCQAGDGLAVIGVHRAC